MIFKKSKKTATLEKDMTKGFKKRIRKKAFEKRQNLLIEERLKKCNVTARKKQIESTNIIFYFKLS